MFLISVKKTNKKGEEKDYEPASLEGKFSSIARYLTEKQYKCELQSDPKFNHCHQVLSCKMKFLELAPTEIAAWLVLHRSPSW